MNERIKQLAEQAEETYTWKEFGPDGYSHITKTKQNVNLEKFAELIVQECVDIISPYTVRMSRPGEEYLHPIQEIRKHFGVEE